MVCFLTKSGSEFKLTEDSDGTVKISRMAFTGIEFKEFVTAATVSTPEVGVPVSGVTVEGHPFNTSTVVAVKAIPSTIAPVAV